MLYAKFVHFSCRDRWKDWKEQNGLNLYRTGVEKRFCSTR